MIKREKTRKNPKKWRLASLAASGGGGVCGSRGVGGSTPHPPYWRCLVGSKGEDSKKGESSMFHIVDDKLANDNTNQ